MRTPRSILFKTFIFIYYNSKIFIYLDWLRSECFVKNGGKLGVITFHSLEDRTVKEIFRFLNKSCICPPEAPICTCNKKKEIELLSKALKPSEEEVKKKAASRSAKLRVVEKL